MQTTDPDDASQVGPFIEHVWSVMEWHRERAQTWDRLATQVVAFSGIIIALAPSMVPLLRSVKGSASRHALASVTVVAMAIPIGSAVTAMFTLSARPRSTRAPTEDIQLEWRSFRKQESSSNQFTAATAQTLIGDPGERTAIIELRDAADRKEDLTRWAVAGLAAGIILMAIVFSIALIST